MRPLAERFTFLNEDERKQISWIMLRDDLSFTQAFVKFVEEGKFNGSRRVLESAG